jgi:hypothetical protein
VRLKNTTDYFFNNLNEVPRSKILLEYLIQIEIEHKNYRSALILATKLLAEAHNKIPIYKTILFLNFELNDAESFKSTREKYFIYLDNLGLNYFKAQEQKAYLFPR